MESPDASKALTGFAHAGLLIGNTMRAYTFGGYGQRTAEYGFYFRSPGTSTARGSVAAGLEGGPERGLQWDASISIGRSTQDYFIYNTVNASYGPYTPTSFRPRGYMQQEAEATVVMSYPVVVSALSLPLHAAWGATWRNETLESRPGNLESYNPGPYADQGFSVGSNGYQGLNPAFAGRWSRPAVALYVDVEADITARWVVDVAARYENYYTSFGSTLTGKVAACTGHRTG